MLAWQPIHEGLSWRWTENSTWMWSCVHWTSQTLTVMRCSQLGKQTSGQLQIKLQQTFIYEYSVFRLEKLSCTSWQLAFVLSRIHGLASFVPLSHIFFFCQLGWNSLINDERYNGRGIQACLGNISVICNRHEKNKGLLPKNATFLALGQLSWKLATKHIWN